MLSEASFVSPLPILQLGSAAIKASAVGVAKAPPKAERRRSPQRSAAVSLTGNLLPLSSDFLRCGGWVLEGGAKPCFAARSRSPPAVAVSAFGGNVLPRPCTDFHHAETEKLPKPCADSKQFLSICRKTPQSTSLVYLKISLYELSASTKAHKFYRAEYKICLISRMSMLLRDGYQIF